MLRDCLNIAPAYFNVVFVVCPVSVLDYKLFEGEDFSWQASEEWLHDWRSDVVRSASMIHRVDLSHNR